MLRRRRKKWNLLLTFVSLLRDSFLLMSLTIWTNEIFAPAALQLLEKGTSGHRLLSAPRASASVLNAGASEPGFALVDVAFGQPSLADCFENKRLKWVEVSSAGYTRYDTEEFGAAFRARGAAFTNASGVFADPCAQHVLSMMLAFARQIADRNCFLPPARFLQPGCRSVNMDFWTESERPLRVANSKTTEGAESFEFFWGRCCFRQGNRGGWQKELS